MYIPKIVIFAVFFALTTIFYFSLPAFAWTGSSQKVIQNANPNIGIHNENNPNFSNNNSIAINNNSAPISPRAVITVAPAVQAVQLPQTGSPIPLTAILLSLLPLGVYIRKLA